MGETETEGELTATAATATATWGDKKLLDAVTGGEGLGEESWPVGLALDVGGLEEGLEVILLQWGTVSSSVLRPLLVLCMRGVCREVGWHRLAGQGSPCPHHGRF